MRLPILTYHSLDESGSPVSVPVEAFERHLSRLRSAGYLALPLSEAIARFEQPAVGDRIVALTFDDGYASTLETALPLMARYGWRATVFPVADYIGRQNDWPGQPAFVPPARLLGWGELSDLVRLGWEIGAHSRTHADLTRLDDGTLADELWGAKAALEDGLAQRVRVFAYPYGYHSSKVRQQVRLAYAAASTTAMGIARPTSDRYALERVDMWYFSHATTARLIGSPMMEPYVAFRGATRKLRTSVGRARQFRRLASGSS
jgi:peptidoglycan/xylan/chitin deacetylase (PgdA/CDA1 family)